MRYALIPALILSIAIPALPASALAETPSVIRVNSEVPDLSDLMKYPFHRLSYERLMGYWGSNTPTWVRRFNETGDGVQNEVRDFMYKGHRYKIAEVSKPHAADAASLFVLFNDYQEPTVAWGYYVVNGSGSWVGVPPLDLAEFVEKLISRQSGWN